MTWRGVSQSGAHPESQGNRGTPGHNHKMGLDQVYGSYGTFKWLAKYHMSCQYHCQETITCVMFYFCSSIDWRYIAILLKHQIAETWKRNNTGPVKNVNIKASGARGGGGSGSCRGWRPGWQPPITRSPGPPDNGQNTVFGQEISFHIPGKCHVRAKKKDLIKKCP